MTWTDERVETAEEAVGRRAFGQPDRRRARRHHPQRGDRQGAPARAVRPRQAPVLRGAAAAQAARPSHMMRVSRPAMRGNTALAHAYELDVEPEPELDRERHPDRPAPHLARAERGRPAAGRSAIRARRSSSSAAASGDRPALLRLSLARRLSAGATAPRPAAGRSLRRRSSASITPALPKRSSSA